MKANIKIYLAILFLLNSYLSFGQKITLDSILNTIKINSHMIHEYDWKIEAAKAYSEGAKSWMAPMVGGGTFMTPYPFSESTDNGSLMFSVQQEIPNPAKLRAKKEFYDSKASVLETSRESVYNELRANAKQLYYQWIILERKKAVLKESEEILLLMKKLANIRYPYSQGSLGNIYKADARLFEVQNMLLMTDAEIEQKNILLNTLMNIEKETRFSIDTSSVKINPSVIDKAEQSRILNRSDVRTLENNIESMRLNSRLMRFDAKPDFNIRFDHMSPLTTGMPGQYSIMAMVSIPIAPWSSKMYKSQAKGMDFEIKAMEMEKEGIINEAEGMTQSMVLEIKKMEQQLSNYKTKIIPALKKNYNTEMLAYEENKGELPMVIDAWEALNMAQIEYLNNLEKQYLMIVNYEKEIEK